MTRALVVTSLLLAACGGAPAPPPQAPASHEPATPRKALGNPRVTVEYVVVHERWVERTMTPNASDVAAWYETPEGKAAVRPERREAWFKTKGAAEAALARARKGELAADDTPPRPALDAAFEKLALGEASIVDGAPGFVVLVKSRPTEQAIERAYRKAKAHEATQRLATELLARLRKSDTDGRAAVAEVVGEILGDRAVADPDRPSPVVVDGDRLEHTRLPANAKAAIAEMLETAKAGETLSAPVVDGAVETVARAVLPTAR